MQMGSAYVGLGRQGTKQARRDAYGHFGCAVSLRCVAAVLAKSHTNMGVTLL